jgi:aryl-alcohol dehydrogenase-like predicted oxidoreductase
MELRMLGRSGLNVSPLCLGGNVFGWTIDEKRSFELLDAFVGAGFNFIDTADVYSTWVPGHQGGESEAIIGNWMKSRGNRASVVIATKVGMEMRGRKGLAKPHILASIEGSLHRLKTDYIDLYQSHKADADTPIEETLAAYAELIAAGKVRAIGGRTTRPHSSAAHWKRACVLTCRAMRAYSPNITSAPARLTSKNSSPSVASTVSA